MRFFLHKGHAANLTKASRLSSETQMMKLNETASKMVLWGQQCSPTCGCAIRFDIQVDDRDRILSASYCAKTVLTTTTTQANDNSRDFSSEQPQYYLKPVRTTRTNRPMLKECKCKTVNTLAQQVVSTLPHLHLSTAQNMLECGGVRSSTATRAVSLSNLNCSPNDSHCYDVLEEALTACLKGYMPQSRVNNDIRQQQQQQQYMQKSKVKNREDVHTDEPINPLRYVQAAKRAGNIFPFSSTKDAASISSMPAFHLDYSEEDKDGYSQSTTLKELCKDFVNLENNQRQSSSTPKSQESMSQDWQDYVDEKYELESSEN